MNTEQRANGPPKNRLAGVTRGRVTKPVRVVLYAVDKLGKSTWASNAPSPLFIGAEDGTSHLDVARVGALSWAELVALATDLLGEHPYRTAVLDTADWAEPMVWAHVARAHGKKSVEDLPYGKGYMAALDEWRVLLRIFDRLRDERGMNVIILAHSWIKTFKNPEGEDFDRFEMKLHAKASGLLREWADAVLFGNHETLTHETNGRTKGISTGERCIYTQRTAAWDAGNRFGLPEKMPLDWSVFAKAIAPKSAPEIRALIEARYPSIDDALRARVTTAVAEAGDDTGKLHRILTHLPKETAQ